MPTYDELGREHGTLRDKHNIFESVHQLSLLKRTMFRRALAIGRRYVYATYIDKNATAWLRIQYAIADRIIFTKLRKRFGGNLRLSCCGGAPLDSWRNNAACNGSTIRE